MERLSTRSRLRAFMLVGALGATLALPGSNRGATG